MSATTISDLTESTLAKIQELIQINLDSAQGFEDAAARFASRDYVGLFLIFAEQRRANAAKLQEIVELNSELPVEEGSYAAAMHRAWLKIRAALNGNDPRVVFVEAERGESAICSAYEAALRVTSESPAHDMLLAQYAFVKKSRDRICEIRDMLSKD